MGDYQQLDARCNSDDAAPASFSHADGVPESRGLRRCRLLMRVLFRRVGPLFAVTVAARCMLTPSVPLVSVAAVFTLPVAIARAGISTSKAWAHTPSTDMGSLGSTPDAEAAKVRANYLSHLVAAQFYLLSATFIPLAAARFEPFSLSLTVPAWEDMAWALAACIGASLRTPPAHAAIRAFVGAGFFATAVMVLLFGVSLFSLLTIRALACAFILLFVAELLEQP